MTTTITPKTKIEIFSILNAVKQGDVDKLEELKLSTKFIHRRFSGRSLLHWACQFGSYRSVVYLLKCGARINAFDEDGFSPLHIAVGENKLKLVKFLIEKGAEIDLRSKGDGGGTPIHKAAAWGYCSVVKHLVKCGSDITIKDKDGFTPEVFAKKNGNTKIARYLNQQIQQLHQHTKSDIKTGKARSKSKK